MFDVCTTGDTAHFDMISKVVATHTCVLFISILFCAAWVAGSLAPFIGATFNSKDLPEFWNYFKFNISLIKLFPSHRRSLTSAILTCRKVRRRSNFLRMSEFGLHIVKYICIYKARQSNTLQPDGTPYERHDARVITQHYSSTAFVSLHFHICKKKFGAFQKYYFIFKIYLKFIFMIIISSHYVDACVATTWISYRSVPCHPWCTHRTSLVVKKKKLFFSFPVSVNTSIKVGPLVLLL